MSEFTISTRIKHKYKTESEWNDPKYENFIPYSGELIIYAPDYKYRTVRFKVGDGKTELYKLKFFESGGDSGQGFLNLLEDYKVQVRKEFEELWWHLGDLGDLLTDEITEEGILGSTKTEIPTATAIAKYVQENAGSGTTSVQLITWDEDDDYNDLPQGSLNK